MQYGQIHQPRGEGGKEEEEGGRGYIDVLCTEKLHTSSEYITQYIHPSPSRFLHLSLTFASLIEKNSVFT